MTTMNRRKKEKNYKVYDYYNINKMQSILILLSFLAIARIL